MQAKIINGHEIAEKIRASLKSQLEGIQLKLGILCSDTSPASISYQETLIKIARSLDIQVEIVRFQKGTPQEAFKTKISEWNEDTEIHGIFLLQPLFEGINVSELRVLIHPLKDIECVHPYNSSLKHFSEDHVGSCTAKAIMEILESTGVQLEGAEIVVVGHSNIVGQPVSKLLIERNATVTTCNKATSNRGLLRNHVERAEVLVVAVGKANCIPGDWIRVGSVVIDVGFNDVGNGKVAGDVEFAVAQKRASYITPMVGGVGPVTAIIAMRQLLIAYKLQQKK
ncbi:MAG: bifunctional 5,10-methylenetetrahydrofolate dehydrogenase/5,10-methenyltetrahydrofolate cyclohydrolase [bacterium]|nr:bifunctional 5,10-methylenetetrahydrofolate dehydrogenase/5,10-methenyltetrahydrofolate cyclohydrolase [bacterium]